MWRLLLGKKRPADHSPPISIENKNNSASEGLGSVAISKTLPDNKKRIEEAFAHCEDLILDNWRYGPDLTHTAFTVYFETLLEHKELNYLKESLQDLVTHKVGPATAITPEQVISFFERNGVSAKSAKVLHDFDQALLKILDVDFRAARMRGGDAAAGRMSLSVPGVSRAGFYGVQRTDDGEMADGDPSHTLSLRRLLDAGSDRDGYRDVFQKHDDEANVNRFDSHSLFSAGCPNRPGRHRSHGAHVRCAASFDDRVHRHRFADGLPQCKMIES